ncbi:DUF1902 domain-containing protein [Castellaniella sp. S9]|uniref:DUF1902 domain-containing protein n=1 Tax=Castellaniella sp. S9 TaxID=2993652 RepID=UPI0022B5CF31|nr:DUF1902 domain-containing protein [Castellaniella sp. S9]
MYKVGYPLWKVVARSGIPVALQINVEYDREARVFIATSKNLRGLVVEAATVDELVQETNNALDMLMENILRDGEHSPEPLFRFPRETALA